MRPPNFLSTTSNRASLSITQTLYDRRALDCTASRPLIQSLQQLMVLTGSSVRVRETLCVDGGLERLVQIMKDTVRSRDASACFKWHLCIQCLLNLGTRGTERVRRRIIEAGAVPLVATVLDNYLIAHSDELELRWRDQQPQHSAPPQELSAIPAGQPELSLNEDLDHITREVQLLSDRTSQFRREEELSHTSANPSASANVGATPASTNSEAGFSSVLGITRAPNGVIIPREQDVFWALEIIAFVSKYSHLRRDMQDTYLLPKLSLRPQEDQCGSSCVHRHSCESSDCETAECGGSDCGDNQCPGLECTGHNEFAMTNDCASSAMDVEESSIFDPKESALMDDCLAMNLRLAMEIPLEVVEPNRGRLRYYQHDFRQPNYGPDHCAVRVNLFELVERFTKFRVPKEFPYWACIIMRNFVRKQLDGIRQCANFECLRWETYPREFAKCRRCKRTKYCSKACQLKAWSMHRYWCAPTPSSSGSTASGSSSAPAHGES